MDPVVGPIGIVWGVLIVAFALIGLARGFLKELGVTTVLLIVVFTFSQWGDDVLAPRVVDVVGRLAEALSGNPPEQSITKASFYIITILIATFISYHGETLAFQGVPPKGATGVLLALVIGLVNGYLVAGTMWFYLAKFEYPFGLFPKELTPLEGGLAEVLPLAVLSPFLPFLAVFMVIIRVIR